MPSLSILIGATSAITVVVVAAVTLSITLSASLDAIDSLGLDATGSLSELAATKLDNYIEKPRNAVLTVNSHTMGGHFPFPSEDPTYETADALGAVMRGAWRTAQSASTVAAILRDGTFIITQRNPNSPGLHMLQAVNVIRNGGIVLRTTSTYIGNGSDSPPELLVGAAQPSEFRVLFQPGNFFWYLSNMVFVDANRLDAWIAPPIILQFGNAPPFLQLSLHAAAYNGTNHSMGILASGVTADQLSAFLHESKISSGAHLFAIGPDERIIATTHPAEWYTIEANVPRNRTTLEPGCSSTITSTAAAPGTPVHWVCRHLLVDHPFAPVRELMADGVPDAGVRKVKLAGETYFVSVRGSQLDRTFGYLLTLLTLIPEEDVIGAVARSQAIAIGVSCAVLVVAVAVSCVVVTMLLSPLEGVAERMAYAAALEDDDAPRDYSAISEVRSLQESYYALSDELRRVRSFVPATVLAGKFDKEEGDDEGDIDYTTRSYISERPSDSERGSNRSQHSRQSQQSAAKRSIAESKRTGSHSGSSGRGAAIVAAAGSVLNVAAGISERIVTVVACDCENFHDIVRKETTRTVSRMYQQFIEAVALAVTDAHGVLDSFHGDRLLMTFNGARPIAMHTRRGVTAAVAIAADVIPKTLRLRTHLGVASSRCRVGNAGSVHAMRFCVFGSAVSRAAALAAAGRVYGPEVALPASAKVAEGVPVVPPGSTVFVSGTVAHDVETTFVTQAVDFTSVVRRATPELVCAVHALMCDAGNNDEWMYVLEKSASAGGAAAKAEVGLRVLQDGDVARSKQLLDAAVAEDPAGDAHAPVVIQRLRSAIDVKEGRAPATEKTGLPETAAVSAPQTAVQTTPTPIPIPTGGTDTEDKVFALLRVGDVAGAKAAFAHVGSAEAESPWARGLAAILGAVGDVASQPLMPGAVDGQS
eukprot:CAMPEP_0174878524 /NCGR_PEP_ID=MMETSP1114-20130205/82802_1 /TAXON_ID=312471 /ORGANISM="Neobodo designis, Strain CCAP 1951/1" /LENGTH=928 /DNA_ID=CAMNT_0016113913 /DNA_START=771 /DNA_END=3557 /DNA_ORIENTATION=-